MADLQQRVIAFLEGRRTSEMTDLIQRHNGVAFSAPSLREVHSPDSTVLQASIAAVLDVDQHLDVAIFLTGVGTTTIFESARLMRREQELRERLDEATVAVRGPKPTAVLRKLGIRVDLTAPAPNTTREVLTVLEPIDLNAKTVAVQLYGEPNPVLSQALTERGARVFELAPYAWDRPVDPRPMLHLLDALDGHHVDALLVTSQAQVDNLFGVAQEAGRVPRLDGIVIGAQGPVAQAALERHGLRASFVPDHGHMGSLVLAAATYFASQGVHAQ